MGGYSTAIRTGVSESVKRQTSFACGALCSTVGAEDDVSHDSSAGMHGMVCMNAETHDAR
jgi:hypothetical protein